MKDLPFYLVATLIIIVLIAAVMWTLRAFNAVTLHTQVISPKAGIECVVVSASDSTSVDCWEVIING